MSEYILPLLESIWAIILIKLEIPKGKYTVQVTELNQKINNLSTNDEPQHAIGFDLGNDYQEDEEE